MFFTSIKNELMETEGWVLIDVLQLKEPLEIYLRTGRIRKVDKLLDSNTELQIKKDIVRLEFLEWLSTKKLITDKEQIIWEEFITDMAKNDSV